MRRQLSNEHSKQCKYKDDDKMQYAYLKLRDNIKILVSAEEVYLFDKYHSFALNDDKEVCIDLSQSDNEPMQIVYGALLFNKDVISFEKVLELSEKLAGYALGDVEEEKVNVSAYEEIIFFPESAETDTYIPFAAFMQTTHKLNNMVHSITMFPLHSSHKIWEDMVNRPFLLACRESCVISDITKENWKQYIDEKVMMEAYRVADLVTD